MNLNKKILRLAVPSILANITVPILGMVDIAVAGHLKSGDFSAPAMIGGVTVGSMLLGLLYWNFGFLRAGTGGMTAQAFGRKDFRSAAEIFSMSVMVALLSAVSLLSIRTLFADAAFLFVKSTDDVKALATSYFLIRIWAAPAVLTLMAVKGWFIGMQDTLSSMAVDIMVVAVNVPASVILAGGAGNFSGFGYDGIAMGTVLSQYCGLILASGIVLVKYGRKIFAGFGLADAVSSFGGKETVSFFKTNGDLFVRSVCFILIYMGFTTVAARYGEMALASSSLIMQIMLLFSYFTDGFAYAAEALSGKYIGESDKVMLKKTVKLSFLWSGAVVLLFIFVNSLFSAELFKIVTDDKEIAEYSSKFMIWLIIVPFVGCAAFTWDGIYVGVTSSSYLRTSALLSAIVFWLLWAVLSRVYGVIDPAPEKGDVAVHILLFAYSAHLLVRSLYQTYVYNRRKGAFGILT